MVIETNSLTKNEMLVILQKYNKSFIDKCLTLNEYSKLFESFDNSESRKNADKMNIQKGKEIFSQYVKDKMSKLADLPHGGMKLSGNKGIEYFVTAKSDFLSITRSDTVSQKENKFKISWDNCSSLLTQLIQKNMFLTKQEAATQIFVSLLIDKYSGSTTYGIELSSKKKELNQQLVGYFKNFYEFCNMSNLLTKYNADYKFDSLECFKNRILLDKTYTEGLKKRLRYEIDVVPLNSNKINYLNKLIPAATFIEDIDLVRKKCDIHRFLGDIVVYQNNEYRISNISKSNIVLTSLESKESKNGKDNKETIYITYKQFKEIQDVQMELLYMEHER